MKGEGGKIVNKKRSFDPRSKNESGLISPGTAFACKRRNLFVPRATAACRCCLPYELHNPFPLSSSETRECFERNTFAKIQPSERERKFEVNYIVANKRRIDG